MQNLYVIKHLYPGQNTRNADLQPSEKHRVCKIEN